MYYQGLLSVSGTLLLLGWPRDFGYVVALPCFRIYHNYVVRFLQLYSYAVI